MPARRRPWFIVLVVVIAVAIVAGVVAFAIGSKDDSGGNAASDRPAALTVNGASNPVGVDPDAVSFAWHVGDTRRGAFQRRYRILVARAAEPRPGTSSVVWDGTAESGRQAFVAYGGPKLAPDTQYWWAVQTTTAVRSNRSSASPAPETSAFSANGTFVTGLRDADWKAQWILPGTPQQGGQKYTYVRKDAHIGTSPIVRATAYVAAQHQYQLFVNGTKVAAGPSYSYPDESYYEATDVTRALQTGTTDAIGVLHFWSGAGQGHPAAEPALLVQIDVLHADGTREVIGTDKTWRQNAAEWLPGAPRNDEGGYTERIDGRRMPRGWDEPGFDDRDWTAVRVLGPAGTNPFTHLVAQRTHIVEQIVQPRSIRTLPSGAVIADYGAVIAARPAVTFAHGIAGRPVAMHVGYVLDPDGRVSTTVATQGTDLSFSYVERSGAQQFQAFTYLGFRYLEIDAPGEKLDAEQLGVFARHTDLPDENEATFNSPDPTLDKVWELVRHSAEYVAQEQFVDTPTREKGQFLGDSFNDSQATMHAFGEQNLSWQALRDFARSQARSHPDGNLNDVYPNGDGKRETLDFTERYPEWVWQYYLQTGDIDTLDALYPAVQRVTNLLFAHVDPKTGLLAADEAGLGQELVDWPPAMRYGYDMGTTVRTTTNVLAAEDFQVLANIAAVLGHHDFTSQHRHDVLVQAINGKLTRPDGVYVDGLEADGTQSAHAAEQASEFALAFGVVPAARVPAVGRYVASLGIKTGPMDGLFLLQGLAAAGQTDAMLRVLTDTKDPGWAHVVAEGGTFSWESWILSDAEGDGMSHGWGSSALVAFQTALLGVTPAIPNARGTGPLLAIDAPSAGPARVEGRVPTVAGLFDVEWLRHGANLRLHLVVPPNGTARVEMPGNRVSVVGAGSYTLTSR